MKPVIEVTAFTMNVRSHPSTPEPGEDRPVELVKVDLRLPSPEDDLISFSSNRPTRWNWLTPARKLD